MLPRENRASSPTAFTTSIRSTGRPTAAKIAYISNRAQDSDQYFNYDLFTLDPTTGESRQLTATESAEYRPHYSPDGKSIVYEATKRGLTDRETTMEDTHVWMLDADGKNRREIGGGLDARQGEPQYSNDGQWIYFTAQERGEVHLYRVAAVGRQARSRRQRARKRHVIFHARRPDRLHDVDAIR